MHIYVNKCILSLEFIASCFFYVLTGSLDVKLYLDREKWKSVGKIFFLHWKQ